MNEDNDLDQFKDLVFMKGRFPALDALSTFIPKGRTPSQAVQEELDKTGSSRWYPSDRGFKVIVPYEGGDYDTEYFTIEDKAWDHEHCDVCGETIESMTPCWVTKDDPCVILCESCYEKMRK